MNKKEAKAAYDLWVRWFTAVMDDPMCETMFDLGYKLDRTPEGWGLLTEMRRPIVHDGWQRDDPLMRQWLDQVEKAKS